jgi:hypothetical protein
LNPNYMQLILWETRCKEYLIGQSLSNYEIPRIFNRISIEINS